MKIYDPSIKYEASCYWTPKNSFKMPTSLDLPCLVSTSCILFTSTEMH